MSASFIELICEGKGRLIDAESRTELKSADLANEVVEKTQDFERFRGDLIFLSMRNSLRCVIDYLASLNAGCIVAPLNPALNSEVLSGWKRDLDPAALCDPGNAFEIRRPVRPRTGPDPDALLLATSGSSSSPKMARIGMSAVSANASQIADALQLTRHEVAFAHLPLFYSYGLSVLHSHLIVGSTVVLTNQGPLSSAFLDQMGEFGVTTLPGVPQHYQMFLKIGLDRIVDSPVTRMTQAGGRLSPELQRQVADSISRFQSHLWVMYGQTEACARITVRNPFLDIEDFTTVGLPVSGCAISIDAPDGQEGEVTVEGPQVMQGYAGSFSDLSAGDKIGGRLRTGDIGRLDGYGRLILTGRSSRITKVLGARANLDQVEQQLSVIGTTAVIEANDKLQVFLVGAELSNGEAGQRVGRILGIPPRMYDVVIVADLPRLASGKVDYSSLK